MKRFRTDDKDDLSEIGIEATKEIDEVLEPIVARYIDEGYAYSSIRDLIIDEVINMVMYKKVHKRMEERINR